MTTRINQVKTLIKTIDPRDSVDMNLGHVQCFNQLNSELETLIGTDSYHTFMDELDGIV